MGAEKRINAVYIGRRLSSRNMLAHFWMFEGETKSRGYRQQLIPALIGESWTFVEDGERRLLISTSRKPVKFETDDHQAFITQWVAEDIANEQLHIDHRARVRLARRETDFDKALAPMRRILEAARFHDERGAIIQRIVTELWRRS